MKCHFWAISDAQLIENAALQYRKKTFAPRTGLTRKAGHWDLAAGISSPCSHRSVAGQTLNSSRTEMLKLIVPLLLCAACSPVSDAAETAVGRGKNPYVTQTQVPVPDYRPLLRTGPLIAKGRTYREPTARAPRDAKAVGNIWMARLKARDALLGAGLEGKTPDGPVSFIDTGFTEVEFANWAKTHRWEIPKHIRWGFVSELQLPPLSNTVQNAIRILASAAAGNTDLTAIATE